MNQSEVFEQIYKEYLIKVSSIDLNRVKDAAPFAVGFLNNVEKPISRMFSGRLPDLKQACGKLSGRPVDVGIASNLVIRFDALPKVPVLMLFNDRDEDFPAQCSRFGEDSLQ